MREMKKGDYAFFYHSNCKTPGVAGIMEIVQEHTPDGRLNYLDLDRPRMTDNP
jgi:predicted RNA-binding protein with PUA-like domain